MNKNERQGGGREVSERARKEDRGREGVEKECRELGTKEIIIERVCGRG